MICSNKKNETLLIISRVFDFFIRTWVFYLRGEFMKKRHFNIYLSIVLIITIFMSISLTMIKHVIETNEDLIILEDFVIDGISTDFKETRLKSGQEGLYSYEAILNKDLDTIIKNDAILVIPRIRGSWHRIFFNDQLIGLIGAEGNTRIHLWNAVYKFVIPDHIIEDLNVIRFESYSEYKLGYGNMPIFIGDSLIASTLYDKLDSLYENFYLVVMGMLFALALMEILLFSLTKTFERSYMFFPISILLISLYLFDYTVMSHAWFSALVYKKILIMALHLSSVVMSFALARIYKCELIKRLAILIIIGSVIGILITPNMVYFSYFYNLYNIVLVILIGTWIFIAFQSYLITKKAQDYMIAVSALFLILPSIYDTIALIVFDGQFFRVAVYGIIFYSIAMLLIGIVNYIEYQKKLFSESKLLEIERSRLRRALVTDELTGLYNHRHFYEVFNKILEDYREHMDLIMIDIDKFRPINEINGHTVGDSILKEIANIIVECVGDTGHIFRYGGEEFVVVYYATDSKSIDIAEQIRISVIESKALHELSGYLPLTLSIGLSSYPEHGISPRALIMKAEKAVTYAKFKGRNKVVFYYEDIVSEMESNDSLVIKDKLLIDFIYTLASVIDMKDVYTGKHSEEVARYAMLIAEELELDDHQRFALRLGGLLHDFGKLSIQDKIISKTTKLTHDEFMEIKTHPVKGYDIVKHIIDDPLVLSCVKSHHERFDGNGYPEGLKGNEISILSRIICVADAYHAMISTRSYRQALGHEYAVSELTKYSGSQFDPEIVDAFMKAIKEN